MHSTGEAGERDLFALAWNRGGPAADGSELATSANKPIQKCIKCQNTLCCAESSSHLGLGDCLLQKCETVSSTPCQPSGSVTRFCCLTGQTKQEKTHLGFYKKDGIYYSVQTSCLTLTPEEIFHVRASFFCSKNWNLFSQLKPQVCQGLLTVNLLTHTHKHVNVSKHTSCWVFGPLLEGQVGTRL